VLCPFFASLFFDEHQGTFFLGKLPNRVSLKARLDLFTSATTVFSDPPLPADEEFFGSFALDWLLLVASLRTSHIFLSEVDYAAVFSSRDLFLPDMRVAPR